MFSIIMPHLGKGLLNTGPRPMTQMRQVLLIAAIVIIGGLPLAKIAAEQFYLSRGMATLETMLADQVLISAIETQNSALKTQTDIDRDVIDQTWIAEKRNPKAALNAAMIASPVSIHVRELLGRSYGALIHAIIMDERGRNVAIAAQTTDYWQGDEAKFLKTAAIDSHEPQLGDIEIAHTGTGRACWISKAIFKDGKAIGAIAVEFTLAHAPESVCNPS